MDGLPENTTPDRNLLKLGQPENGGALLAAWPLAGGGVGIAARGAAIPEVGRTRKIKRSQNRRPD